MRGLPTQLLNSLNKLEHFNEADFIASHSAEQNVTSIRLNPFKTTLPEFELTQKVGWCEYGYYLEERPSFTLDPLFHAGCYYVQEAGSMFLELILKQTTDLKQTLKVLDISAAPGGKSTLINSLISEESLLVSNEVVKSRAETLAYNLSKWGTVNTIVTNSPAARYGALQEVFDIIIADVPCSGSGLFRKQPEAVDEWSESAVIACSVRQQTIMEEILPALKEGGLLIYSTCSYSPQENEEIVEWLCREKEMEYITLTIDSAWGIVETAMGYRFYPHLAKSEGFFCAALRKKSSEGETARSGKKNQYSEIAKNSRTVIEQLIGPVNEELFEINGQIHLANTQVKSFLNDWSKQLYFKKAGIVVGEIKGTDLVPNHELALRAKDTGEMASCELSREDALRYLRKENIAGLNPAKGFTLMTYRNMGIGWAKILPNRMNNYLPNEARILK